jgi:hypothetical protein
MRVGQGRMMLSESGVPGRPEGPFTRGVAIAPSLVPGPVIKVDQGTNEALGGA